MELREPGTHAQGSLTAQLLHQQGTLSNYPKITSPNTEMLLTRYLNTHYFIMTDALGKRQPE